MTRNATNALQTSIRIRDFVLTAASVGAVLVAPISQLAVGLLGASSLPFPLEEIALFVIPAAVVALVPIVVALYFIDQKRAVFYGVATFATSILYLILDPMFVAG